MTPAAEDGRNGPQRAAALVIIPAVLVASIAVTLAYPIARSDSVLVDTSTATVTEGNGTLVASRAWGPWSFKVSINSTSVKVGGAIEVSERLAYRGSSNTIAVESTPVSNASVYSSTDRQVWEWTPAQFTGPVPVRPGDSRGDSICIPISTAQRAACDSQFRVQPVPGVYWIVASPMLFSSTDVDWGNNMLVSLSLAVTA